MSFPRRPALGVLRRCGGGRASTGLHVFDVVDFVTPLVPPGLGFGRLGNFIGGELWGKPTGGDGWGVVFPASLLSPFSSDGSRPRCARNSTRVRWIRSPPSLAAVPGRLEGLALFAFLWWYSSKPRPRYAVSGWFALLLAASCCAVEFVRVPDAQLGYLAFGWLTMGQVLSLPLIAFGLFWCWLSRRSPTLHPLPPAVPAPAEGNAKH